MNKELMISNILKFCAAREIKPTVACTESGVGKNFVTNMKRGQTPSVASVADLAAFLGVSTSDLVGDAAMPAELRPLAAAWAELNGEGRDRLVEYAEDLVAGGRFAQKNHPDLAGAEGGKVG